MVNNRIFWACQAVTVDGIYLTGVQAVGTSGDTPVKVLQDYGRPQSNFKYETKDKTFEITISRVLNRTDSLFHTWSGKLLKPGNIGWGGSGNDDIQSWDITLLYGNDTLSNIGDAGSLLSTTYHKCLLTSLSYSLNADGLITEDITLSSRMVDTTSIGSTGVPSTGNEQSGNIIKRQDISFTLPSLVTEILGTDAPLSVNGQSVYGVQSINLSLDISYSRLNDVGVWRGYDNIDELNKWTFVETPVSISCEINAIARSIAPNKELGGANNENQANETISVSAGSFSWDLGEKNYLQNYSVSGGDAGGGNAEISFAYTNENNDFVLT